MQLIRTRRNLSARAHGQGVTALFRIPFGALRLDAGGRVLEYRPGSNLPPMAPRRELTGIDFFGVLFGKVSFAPLRDTFENGLAHGELSRYIDVDIRTHSGRRRITLFFYLHQATQRAWVFVEEASRLDPASLPLPHIAA